MRRTVPANDTSILVSKFARHRSRVHARYTVLKDSTVQKRSLLWTHPFVKAVLAALFAMICIAVVSCYRRPALDQQLDTALEAGDTNYLQKYFNSGGDVNRLILPARGQRNPQPLLYYALLRSQPVVVDFLLKNGANPNQSDPTGHIPLTWAVKAVRFDVPVQVRTQIFIRLLEAGADPHLKTPSEYKYTPLLTAALSGQSEIVQILLRAGVNVNATNTIGQTALHLAGNAEVAQLLLSVGADPTVRTIHGETAADEALRRNHFDLLKVLTNSAVQTNRHQKQGPD
jgi:hypothetical protein